MDQAFFDSTHNPKTTTSAGGLYRTSPHDVNDGGEGYYTARFRVGGMVMAAE